MSSENLFFGIGRKLKNAEESQMFGKPCFKINGKAFMCFFQDCLVFKLQGDTHEAALKLKGAVLFDPSGKGRAMKEWVQVPVAHKAKYADLAQEAIKYVKSAAK
jgi:hypothetical protein